MGQDAAYHLEVFPGTRRPIFPFFNCNMIVRCQAIISHIPIYRLRERHIHKGSPNGILKTRCQVNSWSAMADATLAMMAVRSMAAVTRRPTMSDSNKTQNVH